MVKRKRSISELINRNGVFDVAIKKEHNRIKRDLIELQDKGLISTSTDIKLGDVRALILSIGLQAVSLSNIHQIIEESNNVRFNPLRKG